jgi:uncharacterized delta-60 repeat protein
VASLASTEGRAISTSDIAVQPDGMVVALGYVSRYYEGLPPEVVVVRLTSDGAMDEEFGDGGVVEVDTFGMPNALGVQPDGILVAGETGGRMGLMRLGADGSPDEEFGDGGVTTVMDHARARAVAIRPDGRIVVAATSASTWPRSTPGSSWRPSHRTASSTRASAMAARP